MSLSHFRKTVAKSLTLEMKLSSPFFAISTWRESVFFTRTRNCRKKANQLPTPKIVTREGRKEKRLGKTPRLLACPNHGLSALEGH